MQTWESEGLGIRWVTLMVDDPDEGPPTIAGAQTWQSTFGLDSVDVCPDPTFSMVTGTTVGTPQMTIVDPRTMKVIDLQQGYSGNYSKLTNLASSNL